MMSTNTGLHAHAAARLGVLAGAVVVAGLLLPGAASAAAVSAASAHAGSVARPTATAAHPTGSAAAGGWGRVGTIRPGGDTFGVASDPGTASTFVASGDDTVTVIDDHTNQVTDTISVGGSVQLLAADPATGRVFGIDKDAATVIVIDTATRQVLGRVGVPARPSAITVDPARGRVFVSLADKTIQVLDASTGQVTDRIPTPVGVDEITVDDATGTVFASGLLKLIAVDPEDHTAETVLSGTVVSGVTATGGTVYVAAPDRGGVVVLDAATGQEQATVLTGPMPLRAAVDPAAGVVLVTDDHDDTATIINTATNEPVGSVPVGHRPWWVSVDPGTHTAYVSGWGEDTVTVLGPVTAPHITTRVLPAGRVGVGYAATVRTDTRVDTVTVTGGTLPAGLELDATTGQISGIPTRAGMFTVSVTVTNSAGTDRRDYTITITTPDNNNDGGNNDGGNTPGNNGGGNTGGDGGVGTPGTGTGTGGLSLPVVSG